MSDIPPPPPLPPVGTGLDVAIPGRAAAHEANLADHLVVTLPIVGEVVLPTPAQLSYYAGVATLLALEIIDWPIALVIAAGHALASQQHHRTVEQFGEALEKIT